MLTDCHNHILPEIDDGSKSVEMSVAMLQMMQEQGIARVIATPHFYCHREKSVASYLERRQRKFEKLMEASPPILNILLGAEVAIEKGLCDTPGIEKLAIEGTDLILLELPYAPYQDWMEEEIDNIAMTYHLTPILAHVHRYLDWYSKAQIKQMMQRRLKAFRSEKLRKKSSNGSFLFCLVRTVIILQTESQISTSCKKSKSRRSWRDPMRCWSSIYKNQKLQDHVRESERYDWGKDKRYTF